MPKPKPERAPGATWTTRLVRGILLWAIPCAVLWLTVTPLYNRILSRWTERAVRLTESPAATHVEMQDRHFAALRRTDFASDKQLYRIRVTDLHFNLILTGALFAALPGIAAKRRLANLGWALLASFLFHLLLFVFFVKFVYATQLGAWSLENYGAFARNFWGLGEHMLDLAFKFALPLILWAAFYYGDLVRHIRPRAASPAGAAG